MTAAPSLILATPNELHARIVRHASEAVLLAALIGTKLAAQRAVVAHGEWEPWVEANCDFTPRTALNYMDTADRARAALIENGNTFGFGSEETETVEERVADALATMIDGQCDDATRERFIAAIRKPKPALPPPAPPKPPRAPRPPLPPVKVAHRYAVKVRTAPEEVRVALFTELRPEFEAWLATATR